MSNIQCPFWLLVMCFDQTNFQNNWQYWVDPTTQLKTTYTCQFVGQCWSDNILFENDVHFSWRHVIEERHGNLEFWLLLNYIITNGTLTHITRAFMVHHKTKLFDVCHVYGFKILKSLIYWKCQHMILCHVDTYVTHLHDTWHLVVCTSFNICEVEPK
jgi:hypothetical protein